MINEYPYIIDSDCKNPENELVMKAVMTPILPGSSVLDVGTNSGWLIDELSTNKGCYCFGIDTCEPALKYARGKNRNVVFGDATDIPFRNSMFDYVTIISVLQQMDKSSIHKSLQEAYRVLKPEGQLIMVNARPSGGWGTKVIYSSPYVKYVLSPMRGDAVILSEHNYMLTLGVRDIMQWFEDTTNEFETNLQK